LSTDELSGLVRFSSSAYFNDGDRPKKVEMLLTYLAGCYPYEDTECRLAKETVYAAIFEGEPFNQKKLEKISSESVAVFRKYIAVSNSGVLDGPKFHAIQADFFLKKGLESEFAHSLNLSTSLLETTKNQAEEYYRQQFELNRILFEKLGQKSDRKSDNNLGNIIESLDLYYIVSKLKYSLYFVLQNNRTITKNDRGTLLMHEVLLLAKTHYADIPICACYVYALEIF